MATSSRRSLSPIVVIVLAVALGVSAGGLLAACSEGSSSSDAEPQSAFAGKWEPVDASWDITWGDGGRSYSIVSGGSGGGLEVEESDEGLMVTLVGKSGARSDALPATESDDVLSFDVPISEESPTGVTLTSTGEGTAALAFVDSDSTWDFQKTDEITVED